MNGHIIHAVCDSDEITKHHPARHLRTVVYWKYMSVGNIPNPMLQSFLLFMSAPCEDAF